MTDMSGAANAHSVKWRWHLPYLTVYRPADTRPRASLNRYPDAVIGVAIVLFRRCWSITWKASP